MNQLSALGDFDVGGRVTGADATADGTRLAILTYDAVWMFEAATPGGDDWFTGAVWWLPFTGVKDAEGICFDTPEMLIIAAEEGAGKFYEVPIKKLNRIR